MLKKTLWKRWYKIFVTRSRNLGLLFVYNGNLWKYNFQKALDSFLYGRPQRTRQIPLMITRQMKKSLSTLGYTEQDVNQMSPSEAHDVVNRGVKKTAKLHPNSKD
ncbi:hypothetical protein ABFA07_021260 [Porites harrisoni]